MFWKAPTVEGVLDGSMDPTGVVLKPRVVEVRLFYSFTFMMIHYVSPCNSPKSHLRLKVATGLTLSLTSCGLKGTISVSPRNPRRSLDHAYVGVEGWKPPHSFRFHAWFSTPVT